MLWVFLKLVPNSKTIVRYIRLERKDNNSWFQIVKKLYLNAHILSRKLDWLHFGFATMALGKENIAKSIGSKMAVSFRGFDINVYPLKHPNCYSLLWKQVDKVHSISNYLLQQAYCLGLQKETEFKIITPAVNVEMLQLLESVKPNDTIQIVTIARLHWIKGIDLAIDTMKILKDKGINFTYHIIGNGLKEYMERFKFQVYELGLTDCIIFKGALAHNETLQLLNGCDIYLQTSINEGFCNALLEAQSIGKLCIAPNVGGIPENIENKKTGWLVSSLEAPAIASKILEVINLTEQEKEMIRSNARERALNYFSLNKQKEAFKNFYK
jgi:colanic acid/amylovoran biosynthesis glycosyltransferase